VPLGHREALLAAVRDLVTSSPQLPSSPGPVAAERPPPVSRRQQRQQADRLRRQLEKAEARAAQRQT
jgi:hypothetical protein